MGPPAHPAHRNSLSTSLREKETMACSSPSEDGPGLVGSHWSPSKGAGVTGLKGLGPHGVTRRVEAGDLVSGAGGYERLTTSSSGVIRTFSEDALSRRLRKVSMSSESSDVTMGGTDDVDIL
jgi:hypothetical protein